jgi:hypothetical protein
MLPVKFWLLRSGVCKLTHFPSLTRRFPDGWFPFKSRNWRCWRDPKDEGWYLTVDFFADWELSTCNKDRDFRESVRSDYWKPKTKTSIWKVVRTLQEHIQTTGFYPRSLHCKYSPSQPYSPSRPWVGVWLQVQIVGTLCGTHISRMLTGKKSDRGCDKKGWWGYICKEPGGARKIALPGTNLIYGRTGKRTAHEIITCDGPAET